MKNLGHNRSEQLVAQIITGILAIVFLGFEYDRVSDFGIYLQASSDLHLGKNIYLELYGPDRRFHYMGSPGLAWILTPFTFISPTLAALIWKTLNLLMLYRVLGLLQAYLVKAGVNQSSVDKAVVFAVLFTSFLLYRNFHMAQFTVLLLFVSLESIESARTEGKSGYGALMLSLGIISKLVPVVVLPYLVYRGHWRNVLLTLLVLLLVVLMPSITLGWEENLYLYQEWWRSINPVRDHNVFDLSTRTIHGIAALISTLTIDGIGNDFSLPLRRHAVNMDPQVVVYLILAVKAILVLGTLWVLRISTLFKPQKRPLDRLYEISYILLITPLIFPQQRSYAFLFILPALFYIGYGLFSSIEVRTGLLVTLLSVAFLFLNLELFLGHFREYYWHYKTLTYGVLIVLGILIWMRPRRITGFSEPEVS
jgi:hypothetical protein